MSSALDLKTKEEKDAELDRRIEALRKKNEALVKRYQEIEEDKKKAEQEGIAITTPRKPRPHDAEPERRKTEKENITVTVDLARQTGDKRVINDWKPGTPRGRKSSEGSDGHGGPTDSHSPPRRRGAGRGGRGGQRGEGRWEGGGVGGGGGRQERREWEPRTPRDGEHGESGGPGRRGGGGGGGGGRRGRGGEGGGGAAVLGGGGGGGGTPGGADRKSKEWEEKRRQNIEKMNEEMEKIAEYERGQRADGDKPIRNFLDDPRRSGPALDTDRKEGSRRHVRNWGGLDFDNVKTGTDLEKEWTSRRPGPKGSVDMTMSMTGRERAEYLRWKKEREQIDEERLARHRNATGQWRREWDAQKTDNMFKEDPSVSAEGITPEQGGRRARGGNSRAEPRGRASDDNKRAPKGPTFGDFVSQGRPQGGPRGDRDRGRGRGPKPSYSMHDNRWEGDKDEEKEKEDKAKREKPKKKRKEEEEKVADEVKAPTVPKAEDNVKDGEDDEDEWEDASDFEEDEDGSHSDADSRGDEKKDKGKEKAAKSKGDFGALPRSRTTSAGSPKEQRTPRPKVHIPPPAPAQESPEGGKPLSPFALLEGHRPVTDWGEEMEMLSPRSSMGGESPLKPPSLESSPNQKKEQEVEQKEEQQVQQVEQQVEEEAEQVEQVEQEAKKEEEEEVKEKEEEKSQASSSAESPQKEENTALDISPPVEKTVTVSDAPSAPADSPAEAPADSALSEVSEVALEADQDAPAAAAPANADDDDAAADAPLQCNVDAEPAAVPADDQSISQPAAVTDEASVPGETDAPPAEAESTPSG